MSAIKETRQDRAVGIVNGALLTMLFLIIIIPLIHIVSASFSDPTLVARGSVFLIPRGINVSGYARVLSDQNIMTGYRNTLFYTFAGTVINLLLTLPAAYAVSFKTLPFRGFFMGLMVFTMYFSGGMIPSYLLVKDLKLLDTWWVLLVINGVSCYNLIVARTFFANGVPHELEEAAMIDGCSRTRCFLTIILPLSKALIGVLALYYAVAHWNSWFSAMLYLSDSRKFPLQLILRSILNEAQTLIFTDGMEDTAGEQIQQAQLVKYCTIVVSSVPVMIIYPMLQKFFDKGVMLGSVKG